MNIIKDLLWGIKPEAHSGGDTIDRLSYQYTPMLMTVSFLTLITTQLVGQPIKCWFPAEFQSSWEKYAESYCFVKNTYWLPFDDPIPAGAFRRETAEIGYYQWVPLMLFVQAVLFYVPMLLWVRHQGASGVSVKGVLYAASMVKKDVKAETREGLVYVAAKHLQESLDTQRDIKDISGRMLSALIYGEFYGTYVTALYLITKLLYVLNVLLQFYLMNHFLAPNYTFWGFGILMDLFKGVSWKESGQFPRVTMCDFQVRVLGNLHRWTVQCVLMINMFNEKVYIFFWWWFLLVGTLALLSLIYWTFVCTLGSRRRSFVQQYLRVMKCVDANPGIKEQRLMDKFVDQSLRPDGVFLLRLIQTNGGDMLTAEMIKSLWDMWRPKHDQEMIENAAKEGFLEHTAIAAPHEFDEA